MGENISFRTAPIDSPPVLKLFSWLSTKNILKWFLDSKKRFIHACGLQLFTNLLVETVIPPTWPARSLVFTNIWERQKD